MPISSCCGRAWLRTWLRLSMLRGGQHHSVLFSSKRGRTVLVRAPPLVAFFIRSALPITVRQGLRRTYSSPSTLLGMSFLRTRNPRSCGGISLALGHEALSCWPYSVTGFAIGSILWDSYFLSVVERCSPYSSVWVYITFLTVRSKKDNRKIALEFE